MNSIQTAFMLMGIGLPTVFFVLFLVILTGKALILLTNKITPELQKNVITAAPKAISSQTTAAIVAAISLTTQGKGQVEKIEKVK